MDKGILKQENRYVSTIIFNRPQKGNSLNADTLFKFGDTLRETERENRTRVVILRGAGEKIFSSGVDLSTGPKEFDRTIKGLEYCIESLIDFRLPVIAMLYGPAIGAGLDFSVMADIRIASERAGFAVPLVKIGRTYYYTAIERLMRLTGIAATKEILLSGRLMNANRALETGLVNQVVSPDKLEAVTYELAREIAEEASPLAVQTTKYTIKKIFEKSQIDSELAIQLHGLVEEINKSSDASEGICAKLEKRKPVFTGK